MIWQILYRHRGEYVEVDFDLGGTPGSLRQAGEPTHTGTFARAGTLRLYPEAWYDLRLMLDHGMEKLRHDGIEMTIEEQT